MEMHGGSVAAYSEGLGHGARFEARLALAAGVHPGNGRSEPLTTPFSGSLRMLVVDDNRDAAESIASLIQMSGHEVRTVTEGAAAIANASTFRPDVVLLDIGMPGMNGHEVARRLRELPDGKSMRLIAMTGYDDASNKLKSAESGIDYHLVKPVDFAALKALLQPDK
jgi:CheY-like chemotaxis protein